MSEITELGDYQKMLESAEAGRHDKAFDQLQGYIEKASEDAEVLNDAGALLHCLGRTEEAIDYFLRARGLQSDSGEIVWNLVEAYIADGRPSEAGALFDDMERMEILNADVVNRTADLFLRQDNQDEAVKLLERSLETWPEQEILKPMIETIRLTATMDNSE